MAQQQVPTDELGRRRAARGRIDGQPTSGLATVYVLPQRRPPATHLVASRNGLLDDRPSRSRSGRGLPQRRDVPRRLAVIPPLARVGRNPR